MQLPSAPVLRNLLLVLALCAACFYWGVLTVQRNVFPKAQLRYLQERFTAQDRLETKTAAWSEQVAAFRASALTASNVMVGDSMTARGYWPDLLGTTDVANRGMGGDTTALILERLDTVTATKAKRAYVMVGMNDFLRGAEVDQVLANYRQIVDRLGAAGMHTTIQSTLHCNEAKAVNGCGTANVKIGELNQRLRALPGIRFVDLNAIFTKSGQLDAAYTDDGIHLNLRGYQAWASAIAPDFSRGATDDRLLRRDPT